MNVGDGKQGAGFNGFQNTRFFPIYIHKYHCRFLSKMVGFYHYWDYLSRNQER